MGSSDTVKTFKYFQKRTRELQNHNQSRNKESMKEGKERKEKYRSIVISQLVLITSAWAYVT
jgi:hypothetical protein